MNFLQAKIAPVSVIYPALASKIVPIDAQNQALVADQQAANAVCDFLFDRVTVYRSTCNFFLFAPEEERDTWMERLNRYPMDTEKRVSQG